MKPLARFVVPWLLAAVAASAVAEESARFRFVKPIERDKSADEEIVGVTLDSDIYAATRDELPDLRIVDNAGVEAPFEIERVTETKTERVRHNATAEIVSLDEHDDTIEVRLRLPDKTPSAEGLSLATPLRDYVRKVQVFGSADGREWAPLVPDGMIYDYSRFADVSRHEITLPQNSFRHFKLVIANVTDEKEFPYKELARTLRGPEETNRIEKTTVERRPLRIDRVTAWHDVAEEQAKAPRESDYPVAGFEVTEDSKSKQTIIRVHTRREPLTSFTLQTPGRNFLRQTVVEMPQTRQAVQFGEVKQIPGWTAVGRTSVSKFSFHNEHREQLTIQFPEQRQQEYRIIIENEDNPPLEIKGVRATGPISRAVFLAHASTPYRVWYGSSSAAAPKYDAATVLGTLRRDNQVVEARLGAQVSNAGYGGEPVAARSLLDNWYFLGTAIGLMVAVLGWGLYRAARRVENLPEQ
jgi:uncharacterized protein DUF3999